ncbi:tRNA dihydrouridine synthase DusB [Kiloniella sp. b19]|uniref:tRNA dihydrouridine synthase DusB n=1 Tax=Kiloniella sp. GXU_MW_B19 TaxID=3141326 RepID=UPI0031D9C296
MTIQVGDIAIEDPVFLAPMSGVSDKPFRRLVKRFGAGLVFSEMIASRAMLQETRESLKMSSNCGEEFPMAVQLAGCDPEIMAEAARMNVDRGAAIIDINFGCPVKKIVNKLAGSALMKDEDLAARIVEKTVQAVSVPVTVKMRLGWDEHSLNAPSIARRAQDLGARMITVHGRTRNQMYKGTANWDAVAAVRDVLDVPLIVNGDIGSAEDARKAMEASGADGVMVGRACYGKPWLPGQIIAELKGESFDALPDLAALKDLILEHYESLLDYYGERQGTVIARKHLSWYCASLPGAADFRREINTIRDCNEVRARLGEFFDHHLSLADAA